jgi:hypothetical protein
MSPRKVRADSGWMVRGVARFRKEVQKRERPPGFPEGRSQIPGDDLLSPAKDYHRPRMLNGRVRDGNGWGHPGMFTEKSLGARLPFVYKTYRSHRTYKSHKQAEALPPGNMQKG